MSLVLFILFMLSSTVYDAIHQTVLWAGLYWRPVGGELLVSPVIR